MNWNCCSSRTEGECKRNEVLDGHNKCFDNIHVQNNVNKVNHWLERNDKSIPKQVNSDTCIYNK